MEYYTRKDDILYLFVFFCHELRSLKIINKFFFVEFGSLGYSNGCKIKISSNIKEWFFFFAFLFLLIFSYSFLKSEEQFCRKMLKLNDDKYAIMMLESSTGQFGI